MLILNLKTKKNTLNTFPHQLIILILIPFTHNIGYYQQTFYVIKQNNVKNENRDNMNI